MSEQKVKKLWLSRSDWLSFNYLFYVKKPFRKGGAWQPAAGSIYPSTWESCTDPALHLAPGGGPIEIKILPVNPKRKAAAK